MQLFHLPETEPLRMRQKEIQINISGSKLYSTSLKTKISIRQSTV